MKLLTVAVPAYNMERLLGECISSFIAAGADERTEILIIDDGSTDSTPALADRLEKENPKLVRALHKPNGGHGSAVNFGLEHAAGKYYKIVDADDAVDAESWQLYISALESSDAELVATDFSCCDANSMEQTEYRRASSDLEDGEYDFAEVCDRLFVRMHSATWRSDILRDNKIKLDEHRYYVDFEYFLFPVPFVKRVYVLGVPLYKYRLGLNGQSVSLESMRKNCESHLFVLERVLSFSGSLEAMPLRENIKNYVARGAGELLASQIMIYLSYKCSRGYFDKIKALDKSVRGDFPRVYANTRNLAVRLLRLSGYMLYPFASLLLRATRK